ncbi:hypothetical protein GCK72_008072 [Caenorhabditis remanei]|uniref:PAN-3 domain-containing protein n=1 Tax=Caenorhabditis remanei TaxID=31234 RepID=A0A6A5HLU2_CAERE|nr:hypothetical protein GCK72_008072 [Caenorhabditis remanei]KAF1768111.1 hypothetical protein GCK72_008072 [Caenorhabditis remanei]
MVMFNGVPDPVTSYPTSISQASTGTMCAETCETDTYCILSFWNTSLNCYLYSVGDMIRIKEDTNVEGEKGKVAFKIQETAPCAQSAVQMFQGITNSFANKPIESYELAVESSNSYEIQYKYSLPYNCPDWVDPVPSCQNCPITMMSFRGTATVAKQTAPTVNSWTECMYACWMDNNCFLAWMKASPKCGIASYGDVTAVTKLDRSKAPTSDGSLNFLAIKYVSDETTCDLSFDLLWDGTHSLKANSTTYSDYQPTATGARTVFNWTSKSATENCDGEVYKMNGVSGCWIIIKKTMNRAEAESSCLAAGGDGLMPIPKLIAIDRFADDLPYSDLEYGDVHVGISRKTTSSPWEWTLPEQLIDNKGMVWLSGEPNSAHTLALLSIAKNEDGPHGLKSITYGTFTKKF